MRKIKPSSENEMVYEFLKMEIDSARLQGRRSKRRKLFKQGKRYMMCRTTGSSSVPKK
jgi:hypothetical protein